MQPIALKVFSARARESALRVRRHQDALGASEQPTGMANPKIRARVAEILAAKQAKGKKKSAHGKGKAKAAKPKDARTSQEKKNQARAGVAKQTGMGDLEGTLVRVAAGMAHGGQDLEPEKHDALVKKGLAKRHADGGLSLTPAGRKWKSAADKGDADAANAALSDAKAGAADQAAKEQAKGAAKQEREKTKAGKLAERAAKQAKLKQAQKQKAQARQKIASERAKAGQKKNAAQQQKSKQSAAAKEEKAKAAAGKQAATQQHKTRVLAEKIKRGEKLSASDQVDAEDAGLVKKTGTKAMTEIDDLAIKAGARHSKMDASHLDEAARHLHAAGATCPDCAPDEEGDDEAAGKAIKSIMDNPAWYAQHECNDIMQAGSALSTLAMLIQSELSEEDEDDADVSQLCDAARTLIKFIDSELDELEGAAGDAAEGRTAGDVPMAKGIELGTLDNGEEVATVSGYAIKSIGDTGLVGGYLVKFGGDGDLSQFRDVFTKATNYGTHTKSDVWVHHRMLPGLGKKQLTNQAELGMDDEGVFVKHLLDLRSAYETKLYGMVQAGKLGWSSGTAPHLVERKSLGDGRHEVTQWTLGLDASYTPMPAGGFVVNAGAMKSLFDDAGIDLLNAMYIDDSPEAIKANSDRGDGLKAESERARRLSIQQRMIHLRETMNGSTS